VRIIYFLLSSFLSSFGDSLLLLAVPVGLGIELNDIRSAIFMWLIPAIAIFSSSYLARVIKARMESSRRDYAYLLIFVSVLEVITAIVTIYAESRIVVFTSICIFVFLYAFVKEGVPRLFYNISIYSYFCNEKDLKKVAGLRYSLTIVATITGGITASYLVHHNIWKFALLIDAITFIVLGIVLLLVGKDKYAKSSDPKNLAREQKFDGDFLKNIKQINIMTPMIFAVNALLFNYLVLVAENLSVVEASIGILYITLLKIPGVLLGFKFEKIVKSLNYSTLLVVTPSVLFFLGGLFLLFPSKQILCLIVLILGIIEGTYWTSSDVLISKLPTLSILSFNKILVRRLSFYQFLSCCSALICYSFVGFEPYVISFSIFFIVLIYYSGRRALN